jgi:ribosomal protein L29
VLFDQIAKFFYNIFRTDEDIALEERIQALTTELAALRTQLAEQRRTQQERYHGL